MAACSNGTAAPVAHSPAPLVGGLTQGLIAYAADQGVGVLDPATGKSAIVAPIPPGAFRVAGPVWGPAPGVGHPVLYFTLHDDRPAETRTAAGVVPYDWLFRIDPFAGTIDPIAASQDSQSEGPIGLVANSHYLALTVGCCATYEVDSLDLTQPSGALKPLARPPEQPAFFIEGAAPGDSGLLAVRQFGTGAWSPDAQQLAVAVNGEIEIYNASAPDGTAPVHQYLAGGNVIGVAWSAPITDQAFTSIKPGQGPQPVVDGLLNATRLPAQADT